MTTNNTFGHIKDGKVYLKAYLEFPEREIGIVKDSEEASLQYFVDRFERAVEKITEVEAAVYETPNKGSYLMKLIHFREYLATYNGIGDFTSLFKKIDALEDHIRDYISENRVKNLQMKQALYKEAQELCESEDWEEGSEKLKELKMKWIRTGSAPKGEEEDLCKSFDEMLDDFFNRRKNFYQKQKDTTKRRLASYQQIIDQLRQINFSKDKAVDNRKKVIDLQKEWKNLEPIEKWKYLKVWKKYKKEVDRFFGNKSDIDAESNPRGERTFQSRSMDAAPPRSIQREVRLTPEEILSSKQALYVSVENMSDSSEISLQELKLLQSNWKKLGMVPNDLTDRDLNNKFRSVCNEIFEHYYLIQESEQRFEGYSDKTKFEQLKIKIKILKETIRDEENILQNLEQLKIPDSLSGQSHKFTFRSEDDKMQYMNQLNKVKTKKRMLKKLQNQLYSDFY